MSPVRVLGLACALSLAAVAQAVENPPRAPSPGPGKPPSAPGPVLTPGPVVTPADPWADAIAAFATADTRDAQSGGVVFVGSSSIRLWTDLEKRYRSYAAINRGFGGSTLADCVRHMDRLVLPHKPRLVIIYAGDNDLAGGRSPEQVLLDFVELTARIQERLPKTQIVFVSIKPSPARVDLLDRIREANTRIRNYVATKPYLQYIDVFTPMLDAQGKPRGELFGRDSLHLNEEGYALWHALISPVLPLDEHPAVLRDAANAPAPTVAAAAAAKPAPAPAPPRVAKDPAEFAKAPAAPGGRKLELQDAAVVAPMDGGAPVVPPTSPADGELAQAPASPRAVKTQVQPAEPSPAPPPLTEEPEPAAVPSPQDAGPAAHAAEEPLPASPPPAAAEGDTAAKDDGRAAMPGSGGTSTGGAGQGRPD
jgi:lysophospholipase L1-like esterase